MCAVRHFGERRYAGFKKYSIHGAQMCDGGLDVTVDSLIMRRLILKISFIELGGEISSLFLP